MKVLFKGNYDDNIYILLKISISPIKIIDNEEDSKSSYRVLYKIPNTFNHIFVRIDQEGLISILLSPLNIWPSISKLQKDVNLY